MENIVNVDGVYNKNIYLQNNKILTLNNLIKHLKYLLVDIIDDNMKFALKEYYNNDNDYYYLLPKYYLTGEKAINSIINYKRLNKSFDFNIHLYKKDDNISKIEINMFSVKILKTLIQEFNKDNEYAKYMRAIIFNKLKIYNLVDDDDKEHYISEQLFYYGTKVDDDLNLINSLFIKIKLKENLFINSHNKVVKYTNDAKELEEIDKVIYKYNGPNIIYLPFTYITCDKLSPLLKISDKSINFNSNDNLESIDYLLYKYDNIYYSNYLYNLYYLLYYICVNEDKRDSNLLKINKISNPNNYNLTFIKSISDYVIEQLYTLFLKQIKAIKDNIKIKIDNKTLFLKEDDYTKYIKKLEKNILIIGNKSLDKYLSLSSIAYNIVDIYENKRSNILNIKKNLCIMRDTSIIDDVNIVNEYNYLSRKYEFKSIFFEEDYKNIDEGYYENINEEKLYKIIKKLDKPTDQSKFGFINCYSLEWKKMKTTYNYSDLNMFCNLKALNLGLENDLENKDLVHDEDPISIYSTKYKYGKIVEIIDKIFEDFNNEVRAVISIEDDNLKLKIGIDNWFDVFSMQSLISLISLINNDDDSYEVLNFDTLKTGDVFEIGQYISTTFVNINIPLHTFLKINDKKRKIFKIRLNATYNNWLYIGKYSTIPDENEILLRRGSKFIVTNITNEIVIINDGSLYDIELIELEILPSYNSHDQEFYINQKEFDNYIFNLIKQKTFQKSGFGSYYDLVFKSKIFLHTTEHVYETYLKHPYKDSKLCTLIKDECILNTGDNAKLIEIKEKYKGDGFDINFMTIENFNHYINGLQYMQTDLYIDYYDEIDEKRRYYRPTHGLSHTLRVSIFGQFIALNLLKFNTFPLVTKLITQEFLIKIGIILLFNRTGRESEASFKIDNLYCCVNADKSHNNPKTRYAEKSIEYLNEYIIRINNEIYNNKLFTTGEIDIYADAIYENHSIMDEINDINDLSKLLKYIFYSAHVIDLTRIDKNIIITKDIKKIEESKSNYNLYFIYSPIKFNNKEEFINNNKLLVSNIQKVFYFTGTNSNDIDIYEDEYYSIEPYSDPEINIIKYKCQTDYKYCIEKILEASINYINNLIETIPLTQYIPLTETIPLTPSMIPEDFSGGEIQIVNNSNQPIFEDPGKFPYTRKTKFEDLGKFVETRKTILEDTKDLDIKHIENIEKIKIIQQQTILEDTKKLDIEDIYNIENSKIKPNYLYLSKKLNIEKSKYNNYEFKKTCIFMNKIDDPRSENDKYLILNKIMEKILDGGFQNNLYNYKYIKYKNKYNNLKNKINLKNKY
jgi:hypothetical protein